MPISRRRRGFERAGALPLDRLGLPRARARELILTRAWERVAGSALAQRSRAVRVSRGVLEIEVESGRWSATLSELLPRLAGKLAREFPVLKVRKLRLLRPGSESREPPLLVEISDEIPTSEQDAPPLHEVAAPRVEVEDQRPADERLEDLAGRYLARRRDQNQ